MTDLGKPEMSFPRSLNKKDERPDVPSEASLPAEQIREHRRNRCSKSASGLAVTPLEAFRRQQCYAIRTGRCFDGARSDSISSRVAVRVLTSLAIAATSSPRRALTSSKPRIDCVSS